MLIQARKAVCYLHHSIICLSHTHIHTVASLHPHNTSTLPVFVDIYYLSVSLVSFSYFCLKSYFVSVSLCLAVDSLPLVLKLLCVIQACDPPSSSSYSKMDGVHFKLLYHGEVKRCCWQVLLSVALPFTAPIYVNTNTNSCYST